MFADDEADLARIHPRKQRKARVSVAMRKSRRWPWASVGTPRGRAELRGRRAHVLMLQTSGTAAVGARHTLGNESALGDGLPPGLSSSIRRGRQPVQAGPGGPHVLLFHASAHAAVSASLLARDPLAGGITHEACVSRNECSLHLVHGGPEVRRSGAPAEYGIHEERIASPQRIPELSVTRPSDWS